MATSLVENIAIRGIACAIPENSVSWQDYVTDDEDKIRKLADSIGVHHHPVAPDYICASDLCFSAAEQLLEEINWDRDSIDAIIFVTQTGDYLLPASSCILHDRLGLKKDCAAFDINLGCSGYVYGLWVVSNLMTRGNIKRVLLMAGDTISKLIAPEDVSHKLLFGDAGTATAIEFSTTASATHFFLGTDGKGNQSLIVPNSGLRNWEEEKHRRVLYMRGDKVFNFTQREVVKLLKEVIASVKAKHDDVDVWILHQANKLLLEHIARKIQIPNEKMVYALEGFGNTSSASIPLAMSHAIPERLKSERLRLILAGFGVGFSWAAAEITCEKLIMPAIVKVK